MDEILVSIVVVSYNAEHTILDTLNSALRQTYDNLELVISDDRSKDNTVAVAQQWLSEYGASFKGGAHLLTAEANQGVCANFNKAIRFSKGKWIKIIAADDILLPNCCEDYVNFIRKNGDAQFVTSYVDRYQNTFAAENLIQQQAVVKDLSVFNKPAEDQLRIMAYSSFVEAPTMFFSRYLFDSVGGFDERYVYEDHPFYINLLEKGYRIYFAENTTVAYRVHDSTMNSSTMLFNYKFAQNSKLFRKERCYKYYSWRQKISVGAYYQFLSLFELLGLNRNNKVSRNIYKKINSLIWRFGRHW